MTKNKIKKFDLVHAESLFKMQYKLLADTIIIECKYINLIRNYFFKIASGIIDDKSLSLETACLYYDELGDVFFEIIEFSEQESANMPTDYLNVYQQTNETLVKVFEIFDVFQNYYQEYEDNSDIPVESLLSDKEYYCIITNTNFMAVFYNMMLDKLNPLMHQFNNISRYFEMLCTDVSYIADIVKNSINTIDRMYIKKYNIDKLMCQRQGEEYVN